MYIRSTSSWVMSALWPSADLGTTSFLISLLLLYLPLFTPTLLTPPYSYLLFPLSVKGITCTGLCGNHFETQ